MNKQIKKLAEQSGISRQYQEEYFGPKLLEQFAELIVKECMSIVKPGPQDGETITCILSLAIMKLEKHFGVKE